MGPRRDGGRAHLPESIGRARVKILELGKFYPPVRGGIETLLRSLCEGFVRAGAEVECVVANDRFESAREQINGVSVQRRASLGTFFSTSLCPSYLGTARAAKANLWHTHFPNPLADLAILKAPAKTPIVMTYHSDIVRQVGVMRIYGRILEKTLRRADKIVVASPRHIEFSKWLRPHRAKCVVIPFGIPMARFRARRSLPAAISREPNGPILLTVGRLVGYKGHRYLIQAMARLKAALWIVGSGPLEASLRAEASAAGVSERVRFFGNVSDDELPAFYQACDVFVLPSITPNEAFGVAQLEAMACGKPVISCDLPSGVPWVNQNEVTGLVVPPADSAALARAIERVLSDPALARRFGESGRARVENEFTEERMIDRYYSLFAELTAA
jgi:glycosyltransferase involved in cell wall biosynthesis